MIKLEINNDKYGFISKQWNISYSKSVKRGQHWQQKTQDVEVKSTNYDTDRLKISTTWTSQQKRSLELQKTIYGS